MGIDHRGAIVAFEDVGEAARRRRDSCVVATNNRERRGLAQAIGAFLLAC